jgi:hypothetical protein
MVNTTYIYYEQGSLIFSFPFKNFYSKIEVVKLGIVVHTCNPSSGETEAGGSLVQGQLELHSKTLTQKKKKKMGTQKDEMFC